MNYGVTCDLSAVLALGIRSDGINKGSERGEALDVT
jgi:hypothetical protein